MTDLTNPPVDITLPIVSAAPGFETLAYFRGGPHGEWVCRRPIAGWALHPVHGALPNVPFMLGAGDAHQAEAVGISQCRGKDSCDRVARSLRGHEWLIWVMAPNPPPGQCPSKTRVRIGGNAWIRGIITCTSPPVSMA